MVFVYFLCLRIIVCLKLRYYGYGFDIICRLKVMIRIRVVIGRLGYWLVLIIFIVLGLDFLCFWNLFVDLFFKIGNGFKSLCYGIWVRVLDWVMDVLIDILV